MAEKIKHALIEKEYVLYSESFTNQLFVILNNNDITRLSKDVSFSFWERLDDNRTVIRFATSWATDENDVNQLIALL